MNLFRMFKMSVLKKSSLKAFANAKPRTGYFIQIYGKQNICLA